MNTRTISRTTQDWRTADPIWADDVRAQQLDLVMPTGLFLASAGLLSLFAVIATMFA